MSPNVLGLLRDYRPAARIERKELSDAQLDELFELARLAPSANNVQPWRFSALRDATLISRAAVALGLDGLADAGAVIAAQAQEGLFSNRWKQQPFAMIDAPIACLHLLLGCQERGLAARLLLDFDRAKLSSLLGLDKRLPLVALIFAGRGIEFLERAAIDPATLIVKEKF